MATLKDALGTRGLPNRIVLPPPIDELLAALNPVALVPAGNDVRGTVTLGMNKNLGVLALDLTPPVVPISYHLVADAAAGSFRLWLILSDTPRAKKLFSFAAGAAGVVLTAAAPKTDGTWATRHRTIDLPAPANPSRRALAMLLGRTLPKPRTAGLIRILASYARRGLISDAPIPASDAPARYRVALADLFGRFGPPTELDVPTPARPAPPTPAPQPHLVLDGPDGVGGGPASPGHVDVEVAVPSVAALAAGSLDIAALELSFDGVALPPIPVAPVPAGRRRR